MSINQEIFVDVAIVVLEKGLLNFEQQLDYLWVFVTQVLAEFSQDGVFNLLYRHAVLPYRRCCKIKRLYKEILEVKVQVLVAGLFELFH